LPYPEAQPLTVADLVDNIFPIGEIAALDALPEVVSRDIEIEVKCRSPPLDDLKNRAYTRKATPAIVRYRRRTIIGLND